MAEVVVDLIERHGPVGALMVAVNALVWAWMFATGKIVSVSQHRDIKDELEHCRERLAFWQTAAWGAVEGAEQMLPGGGDGE